MTPRQAWLIKFIRDYQKTNFGASPSYEEIAEHMKWASKSTAHYMVKRLEKSGHLHRDGGSRRSLQVTATPLPQR